MKKILVVNEGFSSNLGDQAIKESVLRVLQSFDNKADFANYSIPALNRVIPNGVPDQELNAPPKNPGMINRSFLGSARRAAAHIKWYITNSREIKRILKAGGYNIVIIGGGQLINSSEKVKFNIFSLALYCWVSFAKKYTKADVFMLGVGIVDRFHYAESFFYAKALRKIDGIWVRDAYSKESLKKNFGMEAKLMPDFAFYNPDGYNKHYEKENLALVGIYSHHEIVVKFDKTGLTRQDYYKDWHDVIRRYMKEGLEVKLFYTTRSDAIECFLFQEYLQKEQQLDIEIVPTGTLESLCELYKKVKKIYSARMHALILGMNYQCVVEAYPVTQKLETFDKEYIKSHRTPESYSQEIRSVIAEVLEK